jgi:hypothetical protein
MRAKYFTVLIGKVVPMATAFALAVYGPNPQVRLVALVAGVLIITITEYVAILRPLSNIHEVRKKLLDFYLKSFVQTARINGQQPGLRVNLMVVGWNWTLRRHLFQYYQFNMEKWPDANLHFPIRRGCCGAALATRQHRVHFTDLRTVEREAFGLSKQQSRATSHVLAVATVPLYREVKTLRGVSLWNYFGVLNIDAIDELGADFLASEEVHEHILGQAAFAQLTFA